MKENNLIEEEKSMYGICFSTLVICVFLLAFLGFNFPNSITGAVIHDFNDLEGNTSKDKATLENITQQEALNAILQAERIMRELQDAGFGVFWINDTLLEAKKYFKGKNYNTLLNQIELINDTERREEAKTLLIEAQKTIGVSIDYKLVLEKTKAIHERKEWTYEIKDLIRASELRIQEFNKQDLDTIELEDILLNANIEYENERFENSEDLLYTLDSKLIELSAQTTLGRTIYRASKENVANFIKDHYIMILLILGLLFILAILIYNKIRIIILKHKIKEMKIEKGVLDDLIIKSQSDYFAKGDITKQTFDIKMSNFKERLSMIKQNLPVTESQLENRLKLKKVS